MYKANFSQNVLTIKELNHKNRNNNINVET